MASRPDRLPFLLLIAGARFMLAVLAALATLTLAEFAIFRAWGIPMYAERWQIWSLPAGQAVALFVGVRVAAGGGLPAPLARVAPFALVAASIVREAGAMQSGWLYFAWVVILLAGSPLLGLRLALRASRLAIARAAT